MPEDTRAELFAIGELHNTCLFESKQIPLNVNDIRSVVLQITQRLLKYGRVNESTFYGYQRLVKLSDTLLALLTTGGSIGVLLADYLTVIESILLYEDVILTESLSLFAKFTLMRHGQTMYTGQGIDLTQDGQDMVLGKRELLSGYVDKEKETAVIISSGAARAKGTLGLIFPDEQRYVSDLVLHMQMNDKEKVGQWFAENFDPKWNIEERIAAADRFYVERKFPEEIFGPHGESEARFFYSAEVALRYASKLKRKAGKIPHLFVVSHFEFLNHFVMAIFNLQIGNTLDTSEHIEISVLAKNDILSPTIVPLIVRFRNSVQKVIFNRKKGCIEQWTVSNSTPS